jgi:hypothetical protein
MTSNCKVAGLTTIIISLLSFRAPAAAQSEQEKIGAAKKEGAVYWYGSMNVDDASALIAGIHKKYPFIEIKRFRAANAPVLSKLDVEARARALNVDLIDLDGFYVAQALKRNYWIRYVSPELAGYPKEINDPAGLWSGFFILPQVVIYNTNLVQPASAPKNYNDLLDPKWKNRISIPDSGVTWYHGMLQYMGSEKGRSFMKRLAAQNVRVQTGNRMMVELAMAGEHAIGLAAYAHRIGQFQKKGAPMGWIKDDVLVTTSDRRERLWQVAERREVDYRLCSFSGRADHSSTFRENPRASENRSRPRRARSWPKTLLLGHRRWRHSLQRAQR